MAGQFVGFMPEARVGYAVETRFNSEEWRRLSPTARVRRCTVMAEEAQAQASKADGRLKDLYLDLATQWLTLAREIGKAEPPVDWRRAR